MDMTKIEKAVKNNFIEAERNGATAQDLEQLKEEYKLAINIEVQEKMDNLALVKVEQFWDRSAQQSEPTMDDFRMFKKTMPEEFAERASVQDWLLRKEEELTTGRILPERHVDRSWETTVDLPREIKDEIWKTNSIEDLNYMASQVHTAVRETANIEIRSEKEYEALLEVSREWDRSDIALKQDEILEFRDNLDSNLMEYESVQQFIDDRLRDASVRAHELAHPEERMMSREVIYSKNPEVQEICENLDYYFPDSRIEDMVPKEVVAEAVRIGVVDIDMLQEDNKDAGIYAASLLADPESYEKFAHELSPEIEEQIVEKLVPMSQNMYGVSLEDIADKIEGHSLRNGFPGGLDFSDMIRDAAESFGDRDMFRNDFSQELEQTWGFEY